MEKETSIIKSQGIFSESNNDEFIKLVNDKIKISLQQRHNNRKLELKWKNNEAGHAIWNLNFKLKSENNLGTKDADKICKDILEKTSIAVTYKEYQRGVVLRIDLDQIEKLKLAEPIKIELKEHKIDNNDVIYEKENSNSINLAIKNEENLREKQIKNKESLREKQIENEKLYNANKNEHPFFNTCPFRFECMENGLTKEQAISISYLKFTVMRELRDNNNIPFNVSYEKLKNQEFKKDMSELEITEIYKNNFKVKNSF